MDWLQSRVLGVDGVRPVPSVNDRRGGHSDVKAVVACTENMGVSMGRAADSVKHEQGKTWRRIES